jgi:hypothetical protein
LIYNFDRDNHDHLPEVKYYGAISEPEKAECSWHLGEENKDKWYDGYYKAIMHNYVNDR